MLWMKTSNFNVLGNKVANSLLPGAAIVQCYKQSPTDTSYVIPNQENSKGQIYEFFSKTKTSQLWEEPTDRHHLFFNGIPK
jgi:hypothetical protein